MRFFGIVGALSLTCLCAIAAFAARPTGLKQLFAMGAFLAAGLLFLACLSWALTRAKGQRLKGCIAALAVLAVIPAGVEIGHLIRDWQFQRDLPRYQAAAAWAAALAVPGDTVVVLQVPAQYRDLAYAVHISQDDACGVMVDFFWGGGFPVKHTVRRYIAAPTSMERKPCREGWRRGRQRADGWFELAD